MLGPCARKIIYVGIYVICKISINYFISIKVREGKMTERIDAVAHDLTEASRMISGVALPFNFMVSFSSIPSRDDSKSKQ